MDPEEARRSLDAMRRLQDKTREQYIRQGFSRPGVLLIALGLFVVCASFDLPGRWDGVAVVLGDALILGVIAVGWARASVRRRPTAAEQVFVLVASGCLIAGFVAVHIAARLAGLPAPYTIAAAATALAFIAVCRPLRRACENVIR